MLCFRNCFFFFFQRDRLNLLCCLYLRKVTSVTLIIAEVFNYVLLGIKLYSRRINHRLQVWVEINSINSECRAGFKRNYSAVDHMFTLLALIQK